MLKGAMSVTHPPFLLPASVVDKVPPASMGEVSYIDVQVDGRWDGVLAVNQSGECIGVFIGRKIHTYPVPFDPKDIRAVRAASQWNMFLATLPGFLFSFHDLSMLLAFVICPMLLALGVLLSTGFWVAAIVLAIMSWLMMSSVRGFILMRLPTYCAALCSILLACAGLLSRYT